MAKLRASWARDTEPMLQAGIRGPAAAVGSASVTSCFRVSPTESCHTSWKRQSIYLFFERKL